MKELLIMQGKKSAFFHLIAGEELCKYLVLGKITNRGVPLMFI